MIDQKKQRVTFLQPDATVSLEIHGTDLSTGKPMHETIFVSPKDNMCSMSDLLVKTFGVKESR